MTGGASQSKTSVEARSNARSALTGNAGILVILVMACALPAFVSSSLNVSAPSIGLEFHTPATDLGWLIAAFILCSVSLVLPFGRLGDLTSRRALLIVGSAIVAVTAAAIVFVPSFEWLIALRVIQGVGGACIFSTNQAILVDVFPPAVHGRVLGMTAAGVYVGFAAGPVLGGLLTHYFGWRSIFIFVTAWSSALAIGCALKLPPNSQPRKEGSLLKMMHLSGCALYMLAALSLAFGMNEIPESHAYALIIAGIALTGVFVFCENRAKMPLLQMELFRHNPSFLLSNLSALLNYGATFAVSFLLSIYLQQAKGFGADISGLILITAPLIQAVLSPITGMLSDRHSPFKLASLGMAICGVGLIVLASVGPQTSLARVLVGLAIIGTGFATFSAPNMNAIMSGVPRKDSGIAVGFVTTMRSVGQLASMAIIAIIMNRNIGTTPVAEVSSEQVVDITRMCFVVFIVLSAFGVFTSLGHSLRKDKRKE
jgi:MFS family permease